MLEIKYVVLFCAIIVLSESIAILENQQKCSLSDDDCQYKVLQNIYHDLVDTGIPEAGIPKIDPYVIKDLPMPILGLVELTLVDGSADGLKSCTVDGYKLDSKKLQATVDLKCDHFKIAGHYTLKTLPALATLASGINIHGDGSGSVAIEKVHLTFVIPFEFKKHDDGEIYFRIKDNGSSPKFEIGKAVFAGDNLYVGSVDISSVAVPIMNENWEFVAKNFGKILVDKLLDVFFEQIKKVVEKFPAKDFLADDLSQYV